MQGNSRWSAVTATVVVQLLVSAAMAHGQARPAALNRATGSPAAQIVGRGDAKREIQQGVCAFVANDYVEAQRHFERGLKLDPMDKTLPILVARAIYYQFDPYGTTAENAAKAREAIGAYRKVPETDARAGEAVGQLALLHIFLNEDDRAIEVLTKRLALTTLSPQERYDHLIRLALIHWKHADAIATRGPLAVLNGCVECIADAEFPLLPPPPPPPPPGATGRPKPAVAASSQAALSPADRARAQDFARRGLSVLEQAMQLNPSDPRAEYGRYFLFKDLAALTESETGPEGRSAYTLNADDAMAAYRKLYDDNRAQMREEPEEQRKAESPIEIAQRARDLQKTGSIRRELTIDPVAMAVPPSRSASSPPPQDVEYVKEREAARMARHPWQRFTTPEGFSVLMPSPVMSSPAPSTHNATSEGVGYGVAVFPREAPPFSPPPDDSLLLAYASLSVADALLASHGGQDRAGQITFVRALQVGASPGSAYRLTASGYCGDTKVGAFHVFLTDKYFVILVVEDATEDDPHVREFFDSFALGPA